MHDNASPFKQRVLEIIKAIPSGKVMSYGQVAAYTGSPRAARQVGWILNKSLDDTLPWWRVINNAGRITIKGSYFTPDIQADLLRQEGVEVDHELALNIDNYRYQPSLEQLKDWQLSEHYIKLLNQKYLTTT